MNFMLVTIKIILIVVMDINYADDRFSKYIKI